MQEHAIYTGSATVVDGKVVQVYPGLCYPQFSTECPGGTNLAIAVPADPADPLQTNWTKDVYAVNPIVNNTGAIRPPRPRSALAPVALFLAVVSSACLAVHRTALSPPSASRRNP